MWDFDSRELFRRAAPIGLTLLAVLALLLCVLFA